MDETKVFSIQNEDFDLTIRHFNKETKRLAKFALDYSRKKLTGVKIEKENKVKIVRQKTGQFTPLLSKENILRSYGKIKIYKPILVYIMLKSAQSFNKDNIMKILDAYYREKLKRTLGENTRYNYTKAYIRYMVENQIVTRNGFGVCTKIVPTVVGKAEETKKIDQIDETKIKKIADEIYKVATEKSWTGMHRGIGIYEIKNVIGNYSDEELKLALGYLVRFSKLRQMSADSVQFY